MMQLASRIACCTKLCNNYLRQCLVVMTMKILLLILIALLLIRSVVVIMTIINIRSKWIVFHRKVFLFLTAFVGSVHVVNIFQESYIHQWLEPCLLALRFIAHWTPRLRKVWIPISFFFNSNKTTDDIDLATWLRRCDRCNRYTSGFDSRSALLLCNGVSIGLWLSG